MTSSSIVIPESTIVSKCSTDSDSKLKSNCSSCTGEIQWQLFLKLNNQTEVDCTKRMENHHQRELASLGAKPLLCKSAIRSQLNSNSKAKSKRKESKESKEMKEMKETKEFDKVVKFDDNQAKGCGNNQCQSCEQYKNWIIGYERLQNKFKLALESQQKRLLNNVLFEMFIEYGYLDLTFDPIKLIFNFFTIDLYHLLLLLATNQNKHGLMNVILIIIAIIAVSVALYFHRSLLC
jgi:hypothetical protein